MKVIDGIRVLFAMFGAVWILATLAQTADRSARNEARIVAADVRLERFERRQRELDDRISALSSLLRAAVRPIGWDVPDGGR